MKIADLFVNLDIAGNLKVKDALMGTQVGLQKAGEMALTTKAGILGAVLGLEELTRAAVGTGISIRDFTATTALSGAELQKWIYLGRMNNINADEMIGTVKGLQQLQAEMSFNKGVREGMLWFGLDPTKNPYELLEQVGKKMREIGNDQRQLGQARFMWHSMGLDDKMLTMFRAGSMSLAGFRKELVLTGQDVRKLTDVNKAWNQFWYEISATSEKVIATDLAEPITGTVKILSDAIEEMAALIKKAKSLHDESVKSSQGKDIPATGYGMAGGAGILGAGLLLGSNPIGWVGGLIAAASLLADLRRSSKGQESVVGTVGQGVQKGGLWQFLMGGTDENYRRSAGISPDADMKSAASILGDSIGAWLSNLSAPAFAGVAGAAAGGNNTFNIEVNLHGVRDQQVAGRTAQEVTRAIQQLPKGGQ